MSTRRKQNGNYFRPSCPWRSLPSHITVGQRISFLRRSTFGRSNPHFVRVYEEWRHLRDESIKNIGRLNEGLSDDQKAIDNVKLLAKCGTALGREAKLKAPSRSFEFFGGLTALFGEVIGAASSFAEAVKVDDALATFKGIMQRDAAVTRRFYAARSRCIFGCNDAAGVKCNVMTFSDTCSSVSDTLGFSNICEKPSLMSICDNLNENCSIATTSEVNQSIKVYKNINPAVDDTLCAVGKSIFGAIDTFSSSSDAAGSEKAAFVKRVVNTELLRRDYNEIQRLERKLENGCDSELGKLIKEVLESLENEAEEMDSIIDEIIEEVLHR